MALTLWGHALAIGPSVTDLTHISGPQSTHSPGHGEKQIPLHSFGEGWQKAQLRPGLNLGSAIRMFSSLLNLVSKLMKICSSQGCVATRIRSAALLWDVDSALDGLRRARQLSFTKS